jgi:hypothetical protein
MANAKKLTEPQIAALRAVEKGESPWARLRMDFRVGSPQRTIDSLVRRGLLVPFGSLQSLTAAGCEALREATGEKKEGS